MLCLHGEEAGTSTTEKGTFWYCKQPSTCHFFCSEDQVDLYDKAVKKFLATNQKRPKCCAVNIQDQRTLVNDGDNVEIPEVCVQKEKNGATTSRGEMNTSLKDLYVNMENRANFIR